MRASDDDSTYRTAASGSRQIQGKHAENIYGSS